MRIFRSLSLVILLLFPALAFGDDLGSIRLSLIEGDVQVQVQDTTDWTDAVINLPLNEGDRLWVEDQGKAELQIRGGVYARADGNTSLDVLTITPDSAQFYLDRGHFYINNRRGGIKTVQVDTPAASLRSYDNSIMMVDVAEDGGVEVSVLKGYIYAESRSGATRVSAGSTLAIVNGISAELAPIASPDEWERWNIDRDRRLTAWSESSRYLPDELHDYTSDFDDNGRWEYARDYGYVWTPTVVVAGWAPYTTGRWAWFRNSHVWISYDPWGWAPCHYGRWVHISSIGWSWVPPVAGAAYWGPGYVGWVVTPDYVAWVPLAPGEIFYGYGYYGPWSVNIATININTVVVNRTYVNARVNNAVVVVQRDGFGTGHRVPMRIRENPFEDGKRGDRTNIAIAPPPIRPKSPIAFADDGREHLRRRQPPEEHTHMVAPAEQHVAPLSSPMPSVTREREERRVPAPPIPSVVQRSPERYLPPDRVMNTRPDQMKNERRIVREREGSVFKPQPPENLPVTRMKEPRVIIRKPAPEKEKKVPSEQGERGPRKEGR